MVSQKWLYLIIVWFEKFKTWQQAETKHVLWDGVGPKSACPQASKPAKDGRRRSILHTVVTMFFLKSPSSLMNGGLLCVSTNMQPIKNIRTNHFKKWSMNGKIWAYSRGVAEGPHLSFKLGLPLNMLMFPDEFLPLIRHADDHHTDERGEAAVVHCVKYKRQIPRK